MRTKTFVFDVNTFVSAFIIGSYTNALAFDKALEIGRVVCTHDIWIELTDVFLREKFDKYLPFTVRENLLSVIEEQILQWPHPEEVITACRTLKTTNTLNSPYPVKLRVL